MKVYDCSNSVERPTNRGYGGPVENAVVSILKKYGPSYCVDFVDNPNDADILFTNDVFPKGLPKLPKVKRMDGIFWKKDLLERNEPLNEAATEADFVIFISKYSQSSLSGLYPYTFDALKKFRVIENWIDDEIFNPADRDFPSIPQKFIAVATSWAREEKRLKSTLEFAKLVPQLFLVGSIPEGIGIPKNVILLGYMSQYRLANTLREMDAMVNLSYRDAGPKTVAEAAACGLPILFAYSGGTKEIVQGCGCLWQAINDCNSYEVQTETPNLTMEQMKLGLELLLKNYNLHQANRLRLVGRTKQLVESYFKVFKAVLH